MNWGGSVAGLGGPRLRLAMAEPGAGMEGGGGGGGGGYVGVWKEQRGHYRHIHMNHTVRDML